MAGQLPPGAIPADPPLPDGVEDTETYQIVSAEHGVIYGFVIPKPNGMLQVVPDTPWDNSDRDINVREDNVEAPVKEGASSRQSRREREFQERGYVLVNGEFWMPAEPVRLSERAHEMYAKVAPVPEKAEPATQPETSQNANNTAADSSAPAPSPIGRWGLHAAVLLVAGVLIAVVVKTMLLG